MAKIDDDMRQIISGCGLSYVATVTPDGRPNLSPKGSLAVWDDDHLYFADIASPQTMENLRSDPRTEINCVDIVRRRGYRFRGTGEVLAAGPVFEKAAAELEASHGPQYPCEHAVLITVESVRKVLSPAYVFNETPPAEDAMSAIWVRRLGWGGPAADVVQAYEKMLAPLLNFSTVDELRDTFSRTLVQQGADHFAAALEASRDRDQPDEYALADAIETALVARADERDQTDDLERLLNDTSHQGMPPAELSEWVQALWAATG